MNEEEYIDSGLEALEALNDYTEPYIEAITYWAKDGVSLEWFMANWPGLVREQQELTEVEETVLAPWIKTWAEEAFKRLEKENKQ